MSLHLLLRRGRLYLRGFVICFAGMKERCSLIQGLDNAFDTILPGHHGFPVDKSYIDDYIICAERILDGTVEKTKDNGRLAAKYGKVLIMIPDDV